MRLWGKLTWVARAAVAGSILALFGLIVYLILPFRPASFPLVTAGFVLFLAAGLCRSRSNIERIPKRSRAWMWLAWAWWTTAAGTILFAVSFAMAVMSVPRYAFLPSRVMGILLILLGGLAVSRSEICLAPPGSVKRLSLKWAWWTATAGAILLATGAVIAIIPGGRAAGLSLFAAGFPVTLVFPGGAYIITEFVTEVSRAVGRATTIVLFALLIAFLILFPQILVFLATNGNDAAFVNSFANEGLIGVSKLVLVTVVPIILIGFPEFLRRSLTWNQASKLTRGLFPRWLAASAAVATGTYALLLHFSKGPLAEVSVGPLTVAVLFAVALFMPFYGSIATACWQHGVMDVVRLKYWRTDQLEMVREIRAAVNSGQVQTTDKQDERAESNEVVHQAQPTIPV